MKFNFKLLVMLVVLSLVLVACGKSNEDKLIGSWKVEIDGETEFFLEINKDEMIHRLPTDRDSITVDYFVTDTVDKNFMIEVIEPTTSTNEFFFEGYFEDKDKIKIVETEGGIEDNSQLIRVDNIAEEQEKAIAEYEAEEEKRELEEERQQAEIEEQEDLYEEEVEEEYDEAYEEELFQMSCASCHGSDLSGAVGPSLLNAGNNYTKEEILEIIEEGLGSMPGGLLVGEEAEAVSEWLMEVADNQ